jgi:sugar lactone lactonase YvrE/tRNA A-37 threonylcarbamoyl transferase component Bud32
MAVRTELGAGSRLASYTIMSVLGRGAMSVVYRARDDRLGRHVALKVLAPSMGERESFRARFLRESRIAASIDHPNVIPIYEAGEAEGLVFIAMRLVAGTDLRGLLAAEGRLGPEAALKIVEQAASAVDAAHAAGLLHRDIKPGNILLAADVGSGEHVYLSDFGLAVAGDAEGVLEGGGFHGTAEYAAPEQIEGQPDARSDVYSLACVLYECLSGEPPFGRRRLLATLWAHLHEQPPPLSERCPCPPEVDAVLASALAKTPAERPASCSDLAARARAAFGLERKVTPRQPARVAAFVATAAALVAAAAVGLWLNSRPATTPAAPTISTFAGTGRPGWSGDGGPATRAQLSDPIFVAVDGAGNVFIADSGNHSVRRIGRDGIIRPIAGTGEPDDSGDGGPAAMAGVAPGDLTVGPDGNLYFVQHGLEGSSIRRIDRRGIITTVVGTGEPGFLDDKVRTFSPDLCVNPSGLAFDPAGAMHLSCPTAHRVIRVEPDGSFTTVAGSGTAGYSGDGASATEAALHRPEGIAFDRAGNLYIADQLNNRVRKVDTSGVISTFAGTGERGISGDGFRATSVDLGWPVDVAVDTVGNVYILESSVSRLRKVDGEGIITTAAGTGRPGYSGDGGPAAGADLGLPFSFALDRAGNVFIADRGNHRVRKVTAAH